MSESIVEIDKGFKLLISIYDLSKGHTVSISQEMIEKFENTAKRFKCADVYFNGEWIRIDNCCLINICPHGKFNFGFISGNDLNSVLAPNVRFS